MIHAINNSIKNNKYDKYDKYSKRVIKIPSIKKNFMLDAIKEFIVKNEYSKPNIYLLGNSALYTQGMNIDKELRDVDILVGPREYYHQNTYVCKIDCIQPHLALLAPNWEYRLFFYKKIKGISLYALSLEDIIINKISGYHIKKHHNSIKEEIKMADLYKIKKLIEDVKKQEFILIRDELFRNNIANFEKDHLSKMLR